MHFDWRILFHRREMYNMNSDGTKNISLITNRKHVIVVGGQCFVYAKLYNGADDRLLANTAYTLRGLLTGTNITSVTDKEGVMLHENIPDDDYRIDCMGLSEITEVYYMDEQEHRNNNPWELWFVRR